MSIINFKNGIEISQELIDKKNVSYEEIKSEILTPNTSLYIQSLFNEPGFGRMRYITPLLASDNLIVYKRVGVNNNKWNYIGTFSGAKGFIDYNIANNIPVRYLISTSENQTTSGFTTPYHIPHWDSWTIQDIEYDDENQIYNATGDIYYMKANLESGSLSSTTNIIKYDTLGRFGKVYKGDLRYESSNISCLFGDFQMKQDSSHTAYLIKENISSLSEIDTILRQYDPVTFVEYKILFEGNNGFDYESYYEVKNNQWVELPSKYVYAEDAEKIKSWYEFVYNNKLKLLRDCQGNKWIVSVTDGIERSIDNNSSSYPTRISFAWQEIMDISKTPIMNTVQNSVRG